MARLRIGIYRIGLHAVEELAVPTIPTIHAIPVLLTEYSAASMALNAFRIFDHPDGQRRRTNATSGPADSGRDFWDNSYMKSIHGADDR